MNNYDYDQQRLVLGQGYEDGLSGFKSFLQKTFTPVKYAKAQEAAKQTTTAVKSAAASVNSFVNTGQSTTPAYSPTAIPGGYSDDEAYAKARADAQGMGMGLKIALGVGAAVVAGIIFFVTQEDSSTPKKKKSLGKTPKSDSNERLS